MVYVDGFNLYYGLKDSGWKRFYWLNVQLLARNLLKPPQHLLHVKYFTALITSPAARQRRQSIYLEALSTLDGFSIYYGKYHLNTKICRNCGYADHVPSEKMTDVNIAVELLGDAFQDAFDTAILISADSDLTAPIETVRRLFPHKRVLVVFPPNRSSAALTQIASAYFSIGRAKLAQSQFAPEITKPNGFILKRPPEWR